MPRSPYPKEFREQILSLYRSGSTPTELVEEFEPCRETICNWIKQAELDAGERQDGLTSGEKEELAKLRKENRKLRQEREILKKAAAWFAQETNPMTTNGSSNS